MVALTCLIAGGALLGISTNVGKYAGTVGLTPLAFVFWSITGAALLLLAMAVIRRQPPPITKRSIEYYLIAALVSVAGSNLIFFSAIPKVGASFVALTITLPPLLTYLGALLLKMERFDPLRALGVVSALSGAGVLAANKLSAPNASIFLDIDCPLWSCLVGNRQPISYLTLAYECFPQCFGARYACGCCHTARHGEFITQFFIVTA